MRVNERVWSPKDISFLEENYKKFGAKYCAEKLNRTRLAVSKRARMIGVSSKNVKLNLIKEKFTEIVKSSKSLTDILLKMDLRVAGGNFNTIKKYISQLELSTSHFITKQEYGRNASRFNKKPIEYYLVENILCSSSALKNRLYKEGLKKRVCEKCGQDEVWNGEKMSLILDHKNGNHCDCRLENLRILCPNCNATLPTHCRGHKYIEGKIIKDEIKIVTKKENIKKYSLSRRKSERPPYEKLKKEIEEFGYVKTGEKYGVSNNAIKKWIKFYEKY